MTGKSCSWETTVVLLAGGFGTRVAHLLPNLPKPMAQVAGRPFIEWVIRYFNACGFERFILSTGYLSETIESHFVGRPIPGVEVVCRKESVPLGTAGGFLNAITDFPDPKHGWLVANGDSLVVANPAVLVDQGRQNCWSASILGLEVQDASRFGALQIAADGTLQSFAEKRQAGAGLVNAGVYWFAPGCRDQFPSKRPLGFEFDVFPDLISKGARIGVAPVTAPFIDIGTPSSLAEADAFITRGLGTEHFFNANSRQQILAAIQKP
jgi:D-glycero-alpha-D-manno-heptose 1-phosphate guanylyltransferase